MLTKKDVISARHLSHPGILSPSSTSVPLSRRTFSLDSALEPSFGTVLMDSYLVKTDLQSEGASWIDLTLSTSRPLSIPFPPASLNSGSFSPTSPSHPVQETSTIKVDYDPITGNKHINQYEILRELGRGCHGKVKLGRDTLTEELVVSFFQSFCAHLLQAIKIVHKNSRRRLGSRSALSTQMAKIQREIAILKKCNHPHVVQLKEVIDDPAARKIYLVLEYMDRGEVQFVDAKLEKATIRHILRNVITGLEYLHRQGIIHRDIKPANLLWSHDGQVKISDFGVSYCRRQSLTSPQLLAASSSTSFDDVSDISASPPTESAIITVASEEEDFELAKTAGSPAFFAPELCWPGDEGDGPRPPITAAIDVWALGVTLYCLVFGTPPFAAYTEYELFEIIPREPLSIPPELFEEDPDLVDLLQRLLCKDPLKRLTLAEARLHPWILADLSDPQAWVCEANPDHYPKLEVTEDEVFNAVTLKVLLNDLLQFTHLLGAYKKTLAQAFQIIFEDFW